MMKPFGVTRTSPVFDIVMIVLLKKALSSWAMVIVGKGEMMNQIYASLNGLQQKLL